MSMKRKRSSTRWKRARSLRKFRPRAHEEAEEEAAASEAGEEAEQEEESSEQE